MKRWLMRHGPGLGLFGVGSVMVATLLTALFYSGPAGGHSSPLDQAVSDPGEVAVSDLAWGFDFGLIGGRALIAGCFAGWVASRAAPYPRWPGGLAAWVATAMLVFVAAPSIIQPGVTFAMQFALDRPARPDIWLASLLEWLVVGSALVWVALVSWHDRPARRDQTRAPSHDGASS